MKQILIFLYFLFAFQIAKSQFILENTYDTTAAHKFSFVQLQQNGEKFVSILYPNDGHYLTPYAYEMRLYNTDHSLWKRIDLTALPRGIGHSPTDDIYHFLYITDSLFDGDNLVEFMYCVQYQDTISSGLWVTKFRTYIYNENQTLLFVDSTAGPFYAKIQIPQHPVPIANTSAGTKMFLATPDYHVRVYGLSGKLPTQMESPLHNENSYTSVYPNPSSNRIVINYSLPEGNDIAIIRIFDLNGKEIKSYNVDGMFDSLQISTDEYESGTYFYTIDDGSGKIIKGKKFIKID